MLGELHEICEIVSQVAEIRYLISKHEVFKLLQRHSQDLTDHQVKQNILSV